MVKSKLILFSLVCLVFGQASAEIERSQAVSGGSQETLYWKSCDFELVADDRHPIDGPSTGVYDFDFRELIALLGRGLPESYFKGWIADRHQKEQKVHALDLFGSGFFAPTADSVTGLRYGPISLTEEELKMGFVVPPQVYGNIRAESTWTALDRSLKDRNLPGFDLVVMRPVGGWINLHFTSESAELSALNFIIVHTLQRLRPNGEFYFSIYSDTVSKIILNRQLETAFAEVFERGAQITCAVGSSIRAQCLVTLKRY